jgi:predicted chitinase
MDQPEAVTPKSLLGTLSATAAIIGAFIAAGTAGSQAIQGYFQYQIALKKTEQELTLNQRQSDSALAETYLKMILSKDTNETDKLTLLEALTELKDHPLRKWAELRAKNQKDLLSDLAKARKTQFEAVAEKNEATRVILDIESQIEQAAIKLKMPGTDVAEGDRLNEHLVELAQKLAILKGNVGKIEYQMNTATVVTTTSWETSVVRAESTAANLELKLTAEAVKTAFPNTPLANIQTNLPFILSAIKEFQIFDPKLVAAVFATIRVESEAFVSVSETTNRFNTREKPFDLYETGTSMGARLGNSEPGDGAKFKGRGFIALVGRDNYQRLSARLGLASLLTDNPDLANSPEIAARILCTFVTNKSGSLLQSLKADDLAAVRKSLSGSLLGLDRFQETYRAILARL